MKNYITHEEAAIREAVRAEREACAKISETWQDRYIAASIPLLPQWAAATGCKAAIDEGMECSAPAGIALAIRARGAAAGRSEAEAAS